MMKSAASYEELINLADDLKTAAENAHLATKKAEAGEEPGRTDHLQDNIIDARLMAVARWRR